MYGAIAFALSIVLHIVAIAAIATVQLLAPPVKKPVKIMYIKPVTLPKSEIKKTEPVKKPEVKPKPVIKKEVPQVIPDKIATIPRPTPTPLSTPEPISTLEPIVFETPKPIKTKEPKKEPIKLTQTQIQEKQDKEKIAILKKYPYFKNWSDARIKKLELPPGMNNWNEAIKLTEYFDTQNKWTNNPPALGDGPPGTKNQDINPYATPSADSTPIPEDELPKWKEYKENSNDYSIRFYKDDIGFISYFKENERKTTISYFPFTPVISDPPKEDEEINIEIPKDLKKEEIKTFSLPLTKEDLENIKDPEKDKVFKYQLVRDIIRTYNQQKLDKKE